jgi:hypothetical protein
MLQQVASDLERKGLKGAASTVIDMAADPTSRKAINSQFVASQIPALRKLIEGQKEE